MNNQEINAFKIIEEIDKKEVPSRRDIARNFSGPQEPMNLCVSTLFRFKPQVRYKT